MVMVVDDDPITLKQISSVLRRAGHWVVAVEDGEAAYYRAPGLELDLIVLDSVMPGMDGPEVLRRLKGNDDTSGIPVMMLTGRTERGRVEEALELGAEDYIAKPVEPAKLLGRIDRLMEKIESSRPAPEPKAKKRKPGERPENKVRLDLSDPDEDINDEGMIGA